MELVSFEIKKEKYLIEALNSILKGANECDIDLINDALNCDITTMFLDDSYSFSLPIFIKIINDEYYYHFGFTIKFDNENLFKIYGSDEENFYIKFGYFDINDFKDGEDLFETIKYYIKKFCVKNRIKLNIIEK